METLKQNAGSQKEAEDKRKKEWGRHDETSKTHRRGGGEDNHASKKKEREKKFCDKLWRVKKKKYDDTPRVADFCSPASILLPSYPFFSSAQTTQPLFFFFLFILILARRKRKVNKKKKSIAPLIYHPKTNRRGSGILPGDGAGTDREN